jgi:peptide deformylase
LQRQLQIERLGASALRQPAEAVREVDDEVCELVKRMFATMYAATGQGLAAPQVGVSRRIAVVDVPTHPGAVYVLINPRLVRASEQRARGLEGCLSVPGVSAVVERPADVAIEAMNLEGHTLQLEASGELARCLQHEIDHLNGILYLDHLSPLARRMLVDRYRKHQPARST